MTPERLTYDFERDAWVEDAFVRRAWDERPLPEPSEPPTPGRWYRQAQSPLRARDAARWVEAVHPGVFVMGLVALFGAAAFGFAVAPVAMWCALPGLVGVGYGLRRRSPRATARDRSLLENPDDPDFCLVEIEIARLGEVCGVDRGVVWFEGGRLMFAGHRTSFAVGGEDVLPRSSWSADLLHGPWDLVLPLRIKANDVRVSFRPLRDGGAGPYRESRFRERFRAFRLRPPQSRGPRQWPPF